MNFSINYQKGESIIKYVNTVIINVNNMWIFYNKPEVKIFVEFLIFLEKIFHLDIILHTHISIWKISRAFHQEENVRSLLRNTITVYHIFKIIF